MLKLDKTVPVPPRPNRKRNPVWDEAVEKLLAAQVGESIYVPRSLAKVGKPKYMTVAVTRYFIKAGGRGWYQTSVQGDGLRIWKIKEPQKP